MHIFMYFICGSPSNIYSCLLLVCDLIKICFGDADKLLTGLNYFNFAGE